MDPSILSRSTLKSNSNKTCPPRKHTHTIFLYDQDSEALKGLSRYLLNPFSASLNSFVCSLDPWVLFLVVFVGWWLYLGVLNSKVLTVCLIFCFGREISSFRSKFYKIPLSFDFRIV